MSPDKSIVRTWLSGGQVNFLLQLETRLTEVTRRDSWHVVLQTYIKRMSLLLACCKVQLVVQPFRPICYCFTPVFARRCWAITRSVSRDQSPSASRGRSFCSSSNRLLGSMSCFSGVDFGRSGQVLFIFNRQNEL